MHVTCTSEMTRATHTHPRAYSRTHTHTHTHTHTEGRADEADEGMTEHELFDAVRYLDDLLRCCECPRDALQPVLVRTPLLTSVRTH